MSFFSSRLSKVWALQTCRLSGEGSFSRLRSSYGNAFTASHLHIYQNSACRWRKFKNVLNCGRHRLDVSTCRVQMSVGQCSFAFHVATVWNSLPSTLRDSSLLLNTFQRRLKTYLLGQSYNATWRRSLWLFSVILAPDINVVTSLLTYLFT